MLKIGLMSMRGMSVKSASVESEEEGDVGMVEVS